MTFTSPECPTSFPSGWHFLWLHPSSSILSTQKILSRKYHEKYFLLAIRATHFHSIQKVYSKVVTCLIALKKNILRGKYLFWLTVGRYSPLQRESLGTRIPMQIPFHVVYTVKKQRVMDDGVQLAVSFLYKPWAKPRHSCCSSLKFFFPPQISLTIMARGKPNFDNLS